MKKVTSILIFAAAAALVSCNKEMNNPETPQGEGIKVTVIAGNPETKTTLESNGKTVSWKSTDQVGFFNHTAGVNVESSAASIDGEGKATFTATVPAAGTYYAYYPYQNETGTNAPTADGVVARIPNAQTPTPTSFDPKADLLLSSAFSATGATNTPADIRFKRLGAFLKIQFIDGTTGTKLSGEYATSVKVQGEANLSAKYRIHGVNGAVYQTSGYKAITATYEADTYELAADGQYTIIGVRPQTFATGSTLAITITTGKYLINKTLTMPSDVVLGAGNLLPINVTLTDADVKSTSVSISRVWGLYSTSAAAWNEYYGGTANTDRNVAMDEDYIYICETVENTPKIWAISRTNTASVKPVSVVGILTDSFWPTACPRVIKNTDASINGGKDVLVVSSMSNSQTELYLYAYLDGIDKKPTPVKLGGYIGGRRLGDTFTHWGTLQKGMYFFKDYNTNRMMTYKIADTAGWDWATVKSAYATDGTIQTVPAQGNILGPESGAGGFFPYPNDKNNGFFGLRAEVQAYTFSMPSDVWSASGAVETAVSTSTGSGYFLNATSALYFEVGAYKYVVYTRQVSSGAGGVMFLRGSYSNSYADIINARIAGGDAAASFSVAANSTDVSSTNGKSSGNWGFDLAAFQIGDDVYVAALKQNVGLSLFKVSAE